MVTNAFRETYDEPHRGASTAAEWAIREAWKLAYARKGSSRPPTKEPEEYVRTAMKGVIVGQNGSDWWAKGSECESVTPDEGRWIERNVGWYPPIPWVGSTKKQRKYWDRLNGRD